jgi:putative Holliday junction resolvase
LGEPFGYENIEIQNLASPNLIIDGMPIKKEFPDMPVKDVDERFTSKMAKDAMIEMGMKKKDRRDKKLVDEIAATIMLQEYLQSIS